jgi:ATP-dependent Clp protease ATP-binding subunit ClpC
MIDSKPCAIKDIMQCARIEAMRLGHPYIGTKHILLGALREGQAVVFLSAYGVDLDRVRQAVEDLTPTHTKLKPIGNHVPITPRAGHIVTQARAEAHALGCDDPEIGHLLMALLKDPDSASAQVLNPMGVTYESIKQMIA